MSQFYLCRRWLLACTVSLCPCIAGAIEPEAIHGPPGGASPSATPSSIYAKHLASGAQPAATAAPPAAGEIAPMLTPDLEYAPPPDWHEATKGAQNAAIRDPQVTAASHQTALPPPEPRKENGLRRHLSTMAGGRQPDSAAEPATLNSGPGSVGHPIGTLVTTLGATSAVAGLALVLMYLLRRGMPGRAAVLSDDVVCVLGRKQLGPRQFAQLIRIGNKLVLLSVTPEGAEPLAEVTDPVEVDRLLGLCLESTPISATREFQDVMNQLSREYAPAELRGGHTADRSLASDAYLAHRGGRADG